METNTLLTAYINHLAQNHSPATVKNYVADIHHFTRWFAKKYGKPFSPDLLDKTAIDDYTSFLNPEIQAGQPSLSWASMKRHLSALRSFTAFIADEGLIPENPFTQDPSEEQADPWAIKGFKNYLYEHSSSDLTVKYYINDLNSFSTWYTQSIGPLNRLNTVTLSSDIINQYVERLSSTLALAPNSINRKLSSIRKYLEYIRAKEVVIENIPLHPSEAVSLEELAVPQKALSYSKIPPVRLAQKLSQPYVMFENRAADFLSAKIVKSKLKHLLQSSGPPKPQKIDQIIKGLQGKNIKKEFYAPYNVSTASFPLHKKLIFHARHTRPLWYKRYHSYPFVHYVHFGVLLLVSTVCALFLYHKALGPANADTIQARSTFNRTFVFKGKLKDKNNNVITEATDIRLSLYNSPTASGSALAWQEVQSSIKPDSDGNITLVIGNKTPLPEALFQTNTPVYLGITIKDEEELSPRQEIGVPFASNSHSVQGLVPITSSNRQENVLLALDAGGKLSIGGQANPVFQATGGDFTLSGQTLLLTTNESSNGNVVISPNGNGKIELTKALINTSGSVQVEGGLAITATTSASPAISASQDGSGSLFAGSAFGTPRFNIDSQGVITKGVWAGSMINPEFGGFGANVTPSSPGELIYSTSTSAYGHLRPGAAGQCLISNGQASPLWSSCGFLQQLNGALSMTHTGLDFLLGANATGSAKFAFTNMNSTTPTFKIGGSLSITSDNLIQADNQDLKIGGSTTKNILLAQAGGNVGVGTTSPTRTVDVNGTWGGNVDYYTDGANNQTIIRSAKALVYDLEKNTGTTDTSTTTIYNITGLPDVDGTFAYLYTKVKKDLTPSFQTQTITIQINGFQIGTVSTIPGTASSEIIKHYTAVRSNSLWHLIGDPGNTNAADLAEWTPYSGSRPQAGNILSIDASGNLTKSQTPYDGKMAGVVSTNPKITIGQQNTTTTPLALAGRIPVIVSSINGDISSGDFITSSILPGIGMKLAKSGATVGKAIESFTPSSNRCGEAERIDSIMWPDDTGENSARPCFKIQVHNLDIGLQKKLLEHGLTPVDYLYIGKIMTITNVSWSNVDDLIASLDSTVITEDIPNSIDPDLLSQMNTFQTINPVVTVGGKAIHTFASFAGTAVGKIRAGVVLAASISTQNLSAARAAIADLTAGSITTRILVSPLAQIDTIKTNTITTNGKQNLTVNLPATSSALVIKNNESGSEAARIDGGGNASFSGQLSSQTLSTRDATVSGTLHAGNVMADNIEGLDEKVSSFAASFAQNAKPTPSLPVESFGSVFNTASVSAGFGTFYEGLLSLGASTFGNLSVMNQLSIGTTLTLSQNSINTLGTDLNIQPLRQGAVSFLAGAVRIEADGQLSVSENAIFHKNLTIKGKLYAGLISPLPEGDIELNLPSSPTHDSSFIIKDSSTSAVLSINNKGDVASSGSATFSKLNFKLVGQAIASGSFTATATGSAGTAILKSNTTELTIIDPLVTQDSLIYITPANNTNNTVLYLMRQTANTTDGPIGSFTVGVSQPVAADTLFNWLIVN